MNKRIGNMLFMTSISFLIVFLTIVMLFIFIKNKSHPLEDANIEITESTRPLVNCSNAFKRETRFFQNVSKDKNHIAVLTYHRILETSSVSDHHLIDGELNPMIVLKEDFEQQMAYLKDKNFVTLSLVELYLFLINEIDIPEKSVVLTFDDGYKDNFTVTYPLLKNYNFQAVNFLITSAIVNETETFNPDFVQYLSKDELQAACDVFNYQSHTHDFHRREVMEQGLETAYLNFKSSELIAEDIQRSISLLNGENLAFAYPYGEYSAKTIDVLKDLGFKMAFTTVHRTASREDSLYELPRFNMFADTTFEEFVTYVNE